MSLAEACPWLRHYGKVPATLSYAALTLYQAVAASAARVPDPSQVERVKAFVVLKGAAPGNADTERALIEYCAERLIKWSCAREIEFRAELPKTQVGKVDYKVLARQRA